MPVELTIKYSENIVVIVTFCWGKNYKPIAKVSHFHFLNDWTKRRKLLLLDYSIE